MNSGRFFMPNCHKNIMHQIAMHQISNCASNLCASNLYAPNFHAPNLLCLKFTTYAPNFMHQISVHQISHAPNCMPQIGFTKSDSPNFPAPNRIERDQLSTKSPIFKEPLIRNK